MKHSKLAVIAGLLAGLVSGFGYAADDGSSTSDVLETPDCLLEYVKSTGTQFVDTGIKAKSGTKAEIVFSSQIVSGDNDTHNILGASDGSVGMCFHKITEGRWWRYRYNYNDNYIEAGASVRTENIGKDRQPANTKYTYTADFSKTGYIKIVVSGGAYTAATIERNIGSTMSIDRNLYVFANNNAGTANEFHSATIYGLKIWQIDSNDEYQLVRDFRPCIRYGRAALWDAVSGKIFFSGSGTDLTAGPVVTPEFERKAVSYVESTKAQYVDTGVCPKTGTKTEVKVQFKNDWSTTTTAVVLGTGKHGGSSRFWMPAAYNKYMYAGCGSVQCYIEYNHAGGPNPTYSKLNGQINHSEVYTFTTEMTTDGKYNVTAIGGKFDGGYVYRDVSVQGDFLSSPNPMYLFGANENGSLANGSSIRCYGAKIWQTNGVDGTYVLLRDLTPCQKEGRAGMYDAVNDEILYSGSGTDLVIGGAAVWNNTSGDNLFDNPANWSTGAVPTDGDVATVNVSGEMTLIVTNHYALSRLSVTGSGTLTFVGDGSLSYKRLDIASGATVVRTGLAGLVDGGLTGAGTFVLDPGTGNTLTMTKSNAGFTGTAVINSGTVKFGNATSFGPINRSSFIRVRNGGTLDTGNVQDGSNTGEKNKVILEEGATLAANPGLDHNITSHQWSLITTLTLEGDATIDTSHGDVSMGLKWHDARVKLNLGGNTLTVKGNRAFSISYCLISGTGKIDIQEGATVWSTQDYDNVDVSTTFSEGTIHIHEGAGWSLLKYYSSYPARLSVKNLILDGAVTRAADNYTLTVTGSITGKGTTPTLTMAEGAVFKPSGTGYLTVTESFSGTMLIDASGLDLESTYDRVPLFKVGSEEMLSSVPVDFVAGTKPKGWVLAKTVDGLGYDLIRSGFSIIVR